MSDKVKLELQRPEYDEADTKAQILHITQFCCYLAETIETLAGDMMERGETVGKLGERINGAYLATTAIVERLDGHERRLIKHGEHLDELAGKAGELENDWFRLTARDWSEALQRIQALEEDKRQTTALARSIQRLNAANSGREGG